MKIQASKRSIKNGFNKIIGIGYCDAQYLLRYTEPFAYSAGLYGWQADHYNVNGVLISTGYDSINSKNTKQAYPLIHEYEKKAAEIVRGNFDYDEKVKQVNFLLNDFIKEVTKEDK